MYDLFQYEVPKDSSDDTLLDLGSSMMAYNQGGTGAAGAGSMASSAGPIFAAIGAIQSGLGAYFSAASQKSSLKFQASMAALNARIAERTAQSILQAGEQAQGRVSLQAGKVKAAQTVGQGARGVQIGVGSAAEEVATTDLMKETDMLTINANAVRQAWAARMQATNAANEALAKEALADSINPYVSAVTSLLGSSGKVASTWYRRKPG
jgi:hypothetical protein